MARREEGGEKGSGLSGTHQEPSPTGTVSSAISNAVVRLVAEYTGRGPTRARTYVNDDFVAVVLQDTLTRGERSLAHDGRSELVLRTRKAYQDTMGKDLVGAIEEITGRKVLAFLSDNHMDPDIAVECFVLVPQSNGRPEMAVPAVDGVPG
jgi:uncharacterized protein YbcI